MINPLENFEWRRLYELYDKRCTRFNPKSEYLSSDYQLPSDRELYYKLIKDFNCSKKTKSLKPNEYKAMLYWKLYSQRAAVANILKDIESKELELGVKLRFIQYLPEKLDDDDTIIKVIKNHEWFSVRGMKSSPSLPVRSAFLHFLYPNTVSVFDEKVCQAVGEKKPGANQDIEVFRKYLAFARRLAKKYKNKFDPKWSETPVRIIDMALWITRGNT